MVEELHEETWAAEVDLDRVAALATLVREVPQQPERHAGEQRDRDDGAAALAPSHRHRPGGAPVRVGHERHAAERVAAPVVEQRRVPAGDHDDIDRAADEGKEIRL